MPGNFANTYFASQLAFRNAVIGELNEIDTSRIINVTSGDTVTYSLDDEYPPDDYVLYIPLPGTLVAADNLTDPTTKFVINNPNGLTVDFRTRDWFTSPTAIISDNPFDNFTSQNSSKTYSDTIITFKLLKNPSNLSQKVWFKV